MMLHFLPGDATVDAFNASGIEGEIAVCRECLVVGDVSGDTLPEFWENRARFLADAYPNSGNDYHDTVVREFAKLHSGSEINLWFEYELFCQTNMWFSLSLLAETTTEVFRVAPSMLSENNVWDGFGNLTPEDLRECFAVRVKFSRSDLDLGANLWSAFRTGDHAELERLSTIKSPAFPKLREVCVAAIEKERRPREIVSDIVRHGATDFESIFLEFKARAGEYGYGDEQVKKIWQDLIV